MKGQRLFSGKKKQEKISQVCRLLNLTDRVVKVERTTINWSDLFDFCINQRHRLTFFIRKYFLLFSIDL